VGLRTASDPAQLAYVQQEGRVLVTHDADFLRLASGCGIIATNVAAKLTPAPPQVRVPPRPESCFLSEGKYQRLLRVCCRNPRQVAASQSVRYNIHMRGTCAVFWSRALRKCRYPVPSLRQGQLPRAADDRGGIFDHKPVRS
jgi:hypothetical protein